MEKLKFIDPDDINPVEYYNDNLVEDAFSRMLTIKAMQRTRPHALSFVKNLDDKQKEMIIYKDKYFEAVMENGLGWKIGERLSPFSMVQRYIFKGDFDSMLNYVRYEKMSDHFPYIRVGIDYFKKTTKIDRNGVTRQDLKRWDKSTIVSDYGKDYLKRIPTYDDFTIEPDNITYRETIENCYNLYSPFEHIPAKEDEYDELKWYWTRTLLEHIFGEQYDLGLQYISTLYTLPKQKLPILVLVSEERSTGKTTFLDWIDILFGDNTVVINPQDISNSHNSSYTDKNIIMIEESKFENNQALEKLKNLSTQKKILVNPKYVNQYSMPFHGKLIITSNDENKFSKIDDTEIRYWIRKVPTLKGKANHNILNDMVKEIPHFLYFLSTLDPIDTSKSRMVFTPEALNTKALQVVKEASRSWLYKEISILVENHFNENQGITEIACAPVDIKEKWYSHNNTVNLPFITQVLKDEFKLKPAKMQRYHPFELDTPVASRKKSGKPYIFKRENFIKDDDNE